MDENYATCGICQLGLWDPAKIPHPLLICPLCVSAPPLTMTSVKLSRDSPTWQPPCDIVGNYVLSKTLGTGSYGIVRLGQHRTSKQESAVKIMPKETADKNAIKRASSEIANMEKIGQGCPFIVQLQEVLVGDHHIYLIME